MSQSLPDPRFESWEEVGKYAGSHMSGWYWKHQGHSIFEEKYLNRYFADKEAYLAEVVGIGAMLYYAEPVYADAKPSKAGITIVGEGSTMEAKFGLTEDDLVELGFSKNEMAGTGWNSISSMRDSVYYYKNGRITINATTFWTWFLDDEQRNDIAVSSKEALKDLLEKYNK